MHDHSIKEFKIGDRIIGNDFPPFIIAELSGNHNGSLERALSLIDAAADAGADAVKLQTYTADTLTLDSTNAEFKITEGLWSGYTLYELYQNASTPWEWHEELFKRAKSNGLKIFSSPFDPTAVDFLEKLQVPAYKIASFELVDTPLISKVASTNKPIIMSTGVANYSEIEEACLVAKKSQQGFALLHCVSAYPAKAEEMNLRTLSALSLAFGAQVGLSDHTLGSAVSVAAISLGASIIEKHITLRRDDGGPDAEFSLEPREFKKLVRECKFAYQALGDPVFDRIGLGGANKQFRRSLYVVKDIKKGELFTTENIRSIRPGLGLNPKHLTSILGRAASKNLKHGQALTWSMITG